MKKKIQFGGPSRRQKTSTASVIEVDVTRLSDDGRGVAKSDSGKTLFITGALPSERVSCKISTDHKRYADAELLEVLQSSDQRTKPFCPHFNECGGCNLQHLETSAQIEHKQRSVLSQLERFAEVIPHEVYPPLHSKLDRGYRRAARIGIKQLQRDDSVIIGFRRKGSNHLFSMTHCPLLSAEANALIEQIPTQVSQLSNPRAVTHLEILEGDNQILATFRVTSTLKNSDKKLLLELAKDRAISLFIDSGKQIAPLTAGTRAHYKLDTLDLTLEFEPGVFLQVNRELNQQMVTRAMSWLELTGKEKSLDLFSGLGNFSLPLAKLGGQVVGVEGSQRMVELATHNASINGLADAAKFHTADLSQSLLEHAWFDQTFDIALLDPPRDGAPLAVEQLIEKGVSTILYVACQPSSLVREAKSLRDAGYQLDKFCVMDMFPHTHHVECLALFRHPKKR